MWRIRALYNRVFSVNNIFDGAQPHQRHLLAKYFFLFYILKCSISSWMESLRALGMTVCRDFDFSNLEWRDLQLNISSMTVFVLIDSDGICTSSLPVFLDHGQHFAISQCHVSNENSKMIAQETTLVNKYKNYLMHHELNWKMKNCILRFSIYQRDPHATQFPRTNLAWIGFTLMKCMIHINIIRFRYFHIFVMLTFMTQFGRIYRIRYVTGAI